MNAFVQLIRHATLRVRYGGMEFLIDPMLDEAGARPPILHSNNDRRNPLVPLPCDLSELAGPDAVLVTHLHSDHWDETAAGLFDRSVPVIGQPGTAKAFREAGFTSVTEVGESLQIGEVRISRTSGRHGTGEIGERMGAVSGFVLQAAGQPTLYVAGDTIWCDVVRKALDEYRPDWIVLNAGGARFTSGDPIIMDAGDVAEVCRYAPGSRIIAVHMEAINHCLVTRSELHTALVREGLSGRVRIPEDGEIIRLAGEMGT